MAQHHAQDEVCKHMTGLKEIVERILHQVCSLLMALGVRCLSHRGSF